MAAVPILRKECSKTKLQAADNTFRTYINL